MITLVFTRRLLGAQLRSMPRKKACAGQIGEEGARPGFSMLR
jgi:hypothetical protein